MKHKKANKRSSSLRINLFIIFILLIPSLFLFFTLVSISSKHVSVKSQLPMQTKVSALIKGTYLGVSFYDKNSQELYSLEQKVHKHFVIVGSYQAWGDAKNQFDTSWADAV